MKSNHIYERVDYEFIDNCAAAKTNIFFHFSKLQRSKKIYDLSGITIVIVIVIVLKIALLWLNIDAGKFINITNSAMMNYGIWLQVVTILLLSIVFTVIGLRTSEYKWTLLEYYHEIDEEFLKVFHAHLFQRQMKTYSVELNRLRRKVFLMFLFKGCSFQ